MNKSMKPSARTPGAPKPPTPEERAQQIARFLASKKEQYITSFFFGLAHNPGITDLPPAEAAKYAYEAGSAMMDMMFPDKPAESPAK